uniref:Uncharacterized protein LOC100184723 n=1 Tax=Phallusia mammillata TaxID=59560 RepID=A0A6F9DIN5_9ASCI|nr:uncharacterized protein LOC100184723 [Phallusia mammillata]
MLGFWCFVIVGCIALNGPTAVESVTYKPWLTEEVLFLADVCCLTHNEFLRMKVELYFSAKVFTDISTDRNANGSIYVFNSTGSETPSSNPTFTSLNMKRCSSVECLEQAAISMDEANIVTTSSLAAAIEHISKLYSTWQYNRVQRKTLVVITTSTADSRDALLRSHTITNDQNITVYAVGIGNGTSQEKLSVIANGGTDNSRVYWTPNFNCSTCDLVKDLKVNLNTTPTEPDWCTVYKCHSFATCQWRWPYCKCGDGYDGNGTACNRLYLLEFTQSLNPGVVLTSAELRDVSGHLQTLFYPDSSEQPNMGARHWDLHIISSNNGLRYYYQFAGAYEPVDVLVQRYAADVKKWFSTSYFEKYDKIGLGLPQPVGCEHSFPNHISSFYFPITLVNSVSSPWNLCPKGFPRASIQCVPHNTSNSLGLVIGGRFDPTTLNTVSCDANLSQIATSNLDLNKIANVSGQLMLLSGGYKLNDKEVKQALNIIDSIKTAVESLSLKISPHILGNMASAVSELLIGLNGSVTYNKDLITRHKVIDTLTYLAHTLNMSQVVGDTWEFKTNKVQLKVQDIPASEDSVIFAPWQPLYNYNYTMYPLNASLYVNKSNGTSGKLRTVIIFFNSTTMQQPDSNKQGMVAASTSHSPKTIISNPDVTVKMLSAEESYGRINSDTFQAAYVRHQCVTWDSNISDWSGENCCLDNDVYPSTECKCSTGIVSMRTTTTRVPPIIEQSILIIVTSSVFSFVLLTLFVWIIYKRNELDSDPFYHQRFLCLTLSLTYLLYAFALPCLATNDVNNGYGTYLVSWEFNSGMAQTTLLHFAVLSSWLLLTLYCFSSYKQAVETKFPGSYAVFVPFIVYVIAASAVVIDSGYFLGILDQYLTNTDFCRTNDWRFITSTYLADNMCWISGKSFYVASFVCVLVSVIGYVVTLLLAIGKAIKLRGNKHHNRPVMKDTFFALLLSFIFGVCCTFAQFRVESVEESERKTMEICFVVFTGILLLGIILVWYLLPGLRKIDQAKTRDTVAMDNVQSTRLMRA